MAIGVRTLRLSFALLLVATAAAGAAQPSAKIDSGLVVGQQKDGVAYFLGVPYAAPPVGDLRWRAPQSPQSWKSPFKADKFSADCMQQPIVGDSTTTGPHSEDCLYLNVWRSARSAKQLPVMVWIHGGGFVNGAGTATIFNGIPFAKRGVLLVTLNYRLGQFGFFGFPALTREHPEELKGNYGYMDQIAALKWVQRNIAAFGGDPRNVTIFGESAGGGSVHALVASPLTGGLFQKAIVESGGGRGPMLGPRKLSEGTDTAPSAETIGQNFARANGINADGPEALAALRALPADKLVGSLSMQAILGAAGAVTFSGPMIDGRIVVGAPDEIYRAGKQQKVSIMAGANNGDIGRSTAASMEQVFASFGAYQDEARKAYDPEGKGTVAQLGHDVAMDRGMTEPARLTVQLFAAQGLPAYEYRFSYVSPSTRAAVSKSVFAGVSVTDGSRHGMELQFVFDTVRTELPDPSDADESMAQKTNTYWANFAKYGDPNDGKLPNWPRYLEGEDRLMNFMVEGPKGMADPWRARLDLVKKTAPH